MAKTRADYVAEGRASYHHPSRVAGQITDTTMPLFGEGKSWQARAFAQGWREEHQATKVAKTVTMNATTEDGQPAVLAMPASTVEKIRTALLTPSQQRREARIAKMLNGYTTALLWSTSDTHPDTGEMLESLEEFELTAEAERRALAYVTAFYDKHMNDVTAYADLRSQQTAEHDPYECAGHDLWLTAAGHGVGFWDRRMGRLGDRLTAHAKAAGEKFAALGDDLYVHLN